MNKLLTVTAVFGLAPALAFAGGLDRSGQGIGAIFNDPGHMEFSFGYVDPDVSGTTTLFCGLCSSGDVAPAYTQIGAATVMGIGKDLSLGLSRSYVA